MEGWPVGDCMITWDNRELRERSGDHGEALQDIKIGDIVTVTDVVVLRGIEKNIWCQGIGNNRIWPIEWMLPVPPDSSIMDDMEDIKRLAEEINE